MDIISLSTRIDLKDEAINYFWKCWGNENNFRFYENCILNSFGTPLSLPEFYLAMDNDEIIGSYALLSNDLISRQDLIPWLACLYVNEPFRGEGIAGKLLNHGLEQASEMGYDRLYLSTTLHNIYEKYGWDFFDEGFGLSGDPYRIYWKHT